jgi:uncharacterized protein YndB with AHSA1/START domain
MKGVFMAASAINTRDSVVTEIEISAPPERVFAALTNASDLNRWWISPICERTVWEIDARDGGDWNFWTTPASESINGVTEFKCRGKILEFKPPYRLVYSWIANWNDTPEAVTVVQFDLTRTSSGTRLQVTHFGLSNQNTARELYRNGWPGVIARLKNFAETDDETAGSPLSTETSHG